MASKPGILTDWPWKPLGSFKPLVIEQPKAPTGLWTRLSNLTKLTGMIKYCSMQSCFTWPTNTFQELHTQIWRTDSAILIMLLHAGPVDFLYYWLHRALHHNYLYSPYHSHHYSSIVTEPISSLPLVHPFAELIAYYVLFMTPVLITVLTGTASIIATAGYITFVDFMNSMGHCNFELIPNRVSIFPPLKYLMYTPSYHSLHHTQFRTNYSLFMPIYDYITCMSEELNKYGEVYARKHPKLKVKLVDGSSLAVAVLLNNISKGTTQLLLRGKLTKVAVAVAFALSRKGIQVSVPREDEYEKLDKSFGSEGKLVMSKSYSSYKIWLAGHELTEKEQQKAAKGTLFTPFSQFPPKRMRKDCFYHTTPAMEIPRALENVDSCENWLPRRVMSVSRIARIVHGLEGWEEHECGSTISNIDKVWEASLKHGSEPLRIPALSKS
ncbi:Protein ECERIFERUM 1 [Hibiscus syriacus]|uniref:Protein ECERIFERUM 1 n=1 Tax=Hibiscus syriacus TaxID=106335 RepID=A0A6A3BJ79_HIBSY|nr:Protein ECERIFERUM 1 [Hibiscus syriacus]